MFKPGDTVQGIVELDLNQPYEAYSLTVGIVAFREVHFFYDEDDFDNY